MSATLDDGTVCPYCGRPMRWFAGRWFGRGCYECDQCGEFPDLAHPSLLVRSSSRGVHPAQIPAKRDERPRILLVDDSIEQCDLYALMLEPTASVITASRGDEALAIAKSTPLDAIVLDVMMPGMDGWEVCRRLKANPATRSVPILLLTSLDGVDAAGPGHRVGASAVLMKPCPAERLAIAIEEAVRSNAELNQPPGPSRRWRRKQVTAPMPTRIAHSPARIVDVSYGGLRVEIQRDSDDIPSAFDMSLPTSDIPIHVELVWKSRQDSDHWLCGGRVAPVDALAAAEWRGIVDAIQ